MKATTTYTQELHVHDTTMVTKRGGGGMLCVAHTLWHGFAPHIPPRLLPCPFSANSNGRPPQLLPARPLIHSPGEGGMGFTVVMLPSLMLCNIVQGGGWGVSRC